MVRRRILFLYAGISTAILLVTILALQMSGVLGGIVEDLARNYINPELIRLAGAELDISGGRVRLRGIEVGGEDDDSTLVAVDNIELDVNPLGLDVRKIHLQGLQLNLRWTEDGLVFPDLQSLLSEQALARPAADGDRPKLYYLRRFAVTESTVRVEFPGADPIVLTDLAAETSPTSDEGGPEDEFVLTGKAVLAGKYRVELSGTGSTKGDSFRVFLDVLDAPLDLVPQLAPVAREHFEHWDLVSATIKRLTGWVQYQEGTEQEWRFGSQIELQELSARFPDLPYSLFGAKLRASFQNQKGGLAHLQLESRSVDGDVLVDARARNLIPGETGAAPWIEAELTLSDLLIDDRLDTALSKIPAAARIWRALTPVGGRGTGRMVIQRDFPDDGSEPEEKIQFDLDVTGTSIELAGFEQSDGSREVVFPVRLHDVDGSVRLREGLVTIQDVHGRIAGGEFDVAGAVELDHGRPTAFRVDIDGQGIEFQDEVRDALDVLAPGIGGHWDAYGPQGSANFTVRIRPDEERPLIGSPPRRPIRVDVRLLPLAASAAWQGFPARIESIRGKIDIGPEGVGFDLEGARDDQPVSLHGRFPNERARAARERAGQGDGMAMELWLKAPSLKVDEEIERALARLGAGSASWSDAAFDPSTEVNSLTQTWDSLSPSGDVGCELALWKDPVQDQPNFDLRLDLADAEIELATLPMPIVELRGPVYIHRSGIQTRVDVHTVRGTIHNESAAPARVLSQGTILTSDDGDFEVEVVSFVRGLQLTDQLAAALDTPDADGTRLFPRENWDLLAPSGTVDVLLEQTQDQLDGLPETRMKIQLRDVRSDLARLPYPLTGTHGEVVVEGGHTRFRDVRGRMRDVEVLCRSGEVYGDGDTTVIQAVVSAEDFPIDDGMANLMVGPIRTAYLDRRIRGNMHVRDLDVTMRIPEDVDEMRVDLEGAFQATGMSMIVGVDFTDIYGLIRIDEAAIDSLGGDVRGSIEDGQCTVLQHPIRSGRADFLADSTKVRLTDAEGQVHGGSFATYGDDDAMVYEFTGEGTTRASLQWSTVYLRELLEAVGFQDVEFQGQLEGHLVLEELIGSDIVNSIGSGRLRITEGNLGEVPLFTEIYKVLKPRQRPRFTELGFSADFRDRVISLEGLSIVSGLFEARGGGNIDMGGNVDMEIAFPDLLRGPGWLLLPEVVAQLANQVVSFEVGGTLRAPTARPKFLWSGSVPDERVKPLPARLRPRTLEDF